MQSKVSDAYDIRILFREARLGLLTTVDPRDVNSARDDSGRPLLSVAAMDGHRGVCELLIRNGAHLETKCNRGMTALGYAASYSTSEMCEFLLHKGSKVENVDFEGNNCILQVASCGGSLKNLILLCKHAPALVNSRNDSGKTALMLLAERGYANSVHELATRFGVIIDATTPSGLTALHLAVMNGHELTCSVLLELGASAHIRGGVGNLKAHEIAEQNGRRDLAAKIRAKDLDLVVERLRQGAEPDLESGLKSDDGPGPGPGPGPGLGFGLGLAERLSCIIM